MSRDAFRQFIQFAIKVVLVHCLTYFIFGLVMSNLLNYEELFQREIIRDFMLPFGSRTVLGVLLQPIRGLLFAVALWPIRSAILAKKHGWVIVWLLFIVFGILSTTSAAPCSIEGVLYTKLPLWYHLIGLPEITLQTMAFSYLVVWWDNRQSMRTEEVRKGFFSELFMAVVVGCLAYIGYAISSLALFFLSDTDIDFGTAAGDIKNQLMFVVAFVFNVVYILYISRKWLENRVSLWVIWGLAWALDSLVLFFCQWIFFGSSSLITTTLIGLLPASIIALGIRQNYKRPRVS
ncbi:MAG: hypothetical protein H5T64_12170 [Chloroflexi bacterium]|nr:hypothetical protein [Chloroflexota bacterium]